MSIFKIIIFFLLLKQLFYCFIFGFLFIVYCYGKDVIHSALTSTIVYIVMRFKPNYYKLLIVASILYVLALHIRCMIIDYMGWKVDFTSAQMIMTIS